MAKIYKQVSSALVFSRMYDNFNLDYSDWESRGVEWIGEALSYMNIKSGLVPVIETKTVSQYRCTLPCPLKVLDAIMYEGYRLGRGYAVNDTDSNTINDRYHPTETYSLDKQNHINTSFEEGEITFYYRSLPVDCNGYPMIPDNEKVINACCWYIMKTILMRGHVHPIIDWKTAEAMWIAEYPKAINSSMSLDADERELHSQLWKSMLVNLNAWHNSFFDNSAATYEGLEESSTDSWTITFNVNVTGFTITLSPDLPVVVDVTTSQYITSRVDGIYSYLVSKTGYTNATGTITIIGNALIKTITLV